MKLTPTEERIVDRLNDGMGHSLADLHACLEDDLGAVTNVQMHIANVRKKLRAMGHTIICEQGLYRRVVYLRPPVETPTL